MEEVLGRGSIGKCISEWFPMLREHSATWVSNFDSIIRLFVVRGRNHEPDHRRVHLEWPQSCQDPHSVHRRLEQPRISPETCRTVWKPHPCPQTHHNRSIYISLNSQFSIILIVEERKKKREENGDLEEEGSERRSWGGETVAVPSCFLLELESESERDEDQFQEVSVVMDSMILSEETVATQPSICFSYCSFTKTLRFYLRLFLFYSLTYQKKKKNFAHLITYFSL